MWTLFQFDIFLIFTIFVVTMDGQKYDGTIKPQASGSSIVESVCSLIESTCIFPDDKLFMRRLAYVESTDGTNPSTFRTGYYGGIWQVDQGMFTVLQTSQARIFLQSNLTAIQNNFGISWDNVSWNNLTIPLYSALAARLYLMFQSRQTFLGIPRPISNQAIFWNTYYRPNKTMNDFVDKVNRLTTGCKTIGSDVIFILDSSGSIGSYFQSMKDFLKNATATFDIGFGTNQDRIGLIQFSDFSITEFNLSTYGSFAGMSAAIDRVQYMGSGTQTDAALDAMTTYGFSEQSGARPKSEGHPRIGIILTDGGSNNPSLTVLAAQRVHDAGITMISVGMGTGINPKELETIASPPICLHVIYSSFDDVDSLKYIIEKQACDAPVMTSNETSQIPLKRGDGENVLMKIPSNSTGITVECDTVSEGSSTLYVSKTTYPSVNYYDEKLECKHGYPGGLYVNSNGTDENKHVYARIESQDTNSTDNKTIFVTLRVVPGDVDLCNENPCHEGFKCFNNFTSSTYFCECWIDNHACDPNLRNQTTRTSVDANFNRSIAMIKVSIRITNKEFQDWYKDINSAQSKALSAQLCKMFEVALRQLTRAKLVDCVVSQYQKGSVVAGTELFFESQYPNITLLGNDVFDWIQFNMLNSTMMMLNTSDLLILDNFRIVQDFDKTVSNQTYSAQSSSASIISNAELIGGLIAGISAGVAVLVAVIACAHLNKKKKQATTDSSDEPPIRQNKPILVNSQMAGHY